ncbi:ER-golgi trafficking TRAPP I complex 85 kDa subunit-domain-containing protein [Gautieria morchelliformis]|nr:ER-golgi trafficking TRAPP I complex 85 kDa subunit-domain-containing protein [Gautieria morchelliformis]
MSAAPVLPLSLSPHICVLPSSELIELLSSSSLPPLQHLLQSFSPLPQVTTRTTALTPVSHSSFPLRFSNLHDIEIACKEDEDARAGRTIDWIGQRIAKRAAAWVERVELEENLETKDLTTPWWQELQRCTEGDRTPSRVEGWNHPVAVVLAVSTLASNPLQAVTELQSRPIDLPSWVDSARLRHTLIIHPSNSPLSSDEAMALFNAIKKQYGLHTHLLDLTLSHPAMPISVPSLLPELPPTPMPDAAFSKALPEGTHHLNLTEPDIAQFARFVREFVTMSLVPWMERCVLDWNETYSSTRRLPSRLFSSTRRLFGGSAASNHVPTPPTHHVNAYSNTVTHPTSSPASSGPPPQQRRLAEFATFLGDIKLAVSVWEALRKEGRGGSEVLPLLLSPSPILAAHATYALSTLYTSDPAPSVQLRALVYAIRWAVGVRDLESLGGERWLDMAAGLTEEPPPALLLAHAALLSARKGATRRAAMWYVFAAHRLEKCGIKPLTVYFLRKAHDLYLVRPTKSLSPSFEDVGFRKDIDGFGAILPSIEYSLGRLMYTSGDTEGALRYFLGLLKGSSLRSQTTETDALYIGDFKVAFEHLKSTVGQNAFPADLKPPFSFSSAVDTKLRLARQGELDVNNVRWEAFGETWANFRKSRGKEGLEKGGKAVVGERFWVDVMLKNPLDVEVNLANMTVNVEGTDAIDDIEIEIIDNILLHPKECRVVPVAIVSRRPGFFKITRLTYSFLALLPVSEPLAVRGPRLHQTVAQRQGVVYGPDVVLTINVEEGGCRLDLSLSSTARDLRRLILGSGECTELTLNIRNTGQGNIDDIWIMHSSTVWFDLEGQGSQTSIPSTRTEVLRSDNSIANATPTALPLERLHGSSTLAPEESLNIRLVIHAEQPGAQELVVLIIFRESGQTTFDSSRLYHLFDVDPVLNVGAFARPSTSSSVSYVVNVEVENTSEASDLRISQITTASASWSCTTIVPHPLVHLPCLPPRQTGRILLQAKHWDEGSGSGETTHFVIRQLGAVLEGRQAEPSNPPSLDLLFNHITEAEEPISTCKLPTVTLLESSRRISTRNLLLNQYYQLSPSTLPYIFPLRIPQALDVIVFWEMPSERRRGYVTVPGLLLGASHAPLDEVIQQSETAKVKRTMYAETTREKGEILEAVRASEWNAEMNPTVVRVVSQPRIEHDFSQGHCFVPVTFMIRNFSLTNHTRFVLRLQSGDSFQSSEAQHLPPSYTGSLTRRGTLEPLSSVEVKTKMWVSRPGIYGLSGWRLETEVGQAAAEPWLTRASFSQAPPLGEESIVTVVQRSNFMI